MSDSPSYRHETKHDPYRPARAAQSKSSKGGRHFIGFPSDNPAPASYPYREADYLGECEFIGSRPRFSEFPSRDTVIDRHVLSKLWQFVQSELDSSRTAEQAEAERTRTAARAAARAYEAIEARAASARETERAETVAACKAECAEFFVAAFSAIYPRANPERFRAAIARALNPS